MEKLPRATDIRHSKLKFWTPHIEAWHKSDMTVKAYCKAHELVISQFKYWQYVIAPHTKGPSREKRSQQKNAVSFIKVNANSNTAPQKQSGLMKVNLASGHELIIEQPVTTDLLKSLISLLR